MELHRVHEEPYANGYESARNYTKDARPCEHPDCEGYDLWSEGAYTWLRCPLHEEDDDR